MVKHSTATEAYTVKRKCLLMYVPQPHVSVLSPPLLPAQMLTACYTFFQKKCTVLYSHIQAYYKCAVQTILHMSFSFQTV